MRGVRAKEIRRAIYGADGSARFRGWSSTEKAQTFCYRVVDHLGMVVGETVRRWWHGTVTADPLRRLYQYAKRARRGQNWRTV